MYCSIPSPHSGCFCSPFGESSACSASSPTAGAAPPCETVLPADATVSLLDQLEIVFTCTAVARFGMLPRLRWGRCCMCLVGTGQVCPTPSHSSGLVDWKVRVLVREMGLPAPSHHSHLDGCLPLQTYEPGSGFSDSVLYTHRIYLYGLTGLEGLFGWG